MSQETDAGRCAGMPKCDFLRFCLTTTDGVGLGSAQLGNVAISAHPEQLAGLAPATGESTCMKPE